MLSQLVYVSDRKATCSAKEIEKILISCKKNNASLNVTGVLLYSLNKFIQYLEGDSKAILRLYETIKLDPRHERTMMISYGPITQRLFPSWQMATREIDRLNIEFRTDISPEDKEIFQKLLAGSTYNDSRVLVLLKKFFS
jgi:hypothetical protein